MLQGVHVKKKGRSFNYSCRKTLGSFCVTAMWAVVYTVCLRCTIAISVSHVIFICIPLVHLKSPSPSLFVCVRKRHLDSSVCRLGKWVMILLASDNRHMKAKLVCVDKQSTAVEKWMWKQGSRNSNLLSWSSTKNGTDQKSHCVLYYLLLRKPQNCRWMIIIIFLIQSLGKGLVEGVS